MASVDVTEPARRPFSGRRVHLGDLVLHEFLDVYQAEYFPLVLRQFVDRLQHALAVGKHAPRRLAHDVVGEDAARFEQLELLGAEIVADRTDRPHLGEETRRQAEVDGGAAEHPLALAERRLDRVEGD